MLTLYNPNALYTTHAHTQAQANARCLLTKLYTPTANLVHTANAHLAYTTHRYTPLHTKLTCRNCTFLPQHTLLTRTRQRNATTLHYWLSDWWTRDSGNTSFGRGWWTRDSGNTKTRSKTHLRHQHLINDRLADASAFLDSGATSGTVHTIQCVKTEDIYG